MNAEASFRGTGEITLPSISVMKALNSFIPPSPSTIRAEADDKAFAQLLGDVADHHHEQEESRPHEYLCHFQPPSDDDSRNVVVN